MKYVKIIVIGFIFFLNACGFQPLYGDNREVLEASSAVQIQPIEGEGGYQMEMILQNRLNPKHKVVSPKYRLVVTIGQPKYTNQSIRSDNFATLETMRIKTSYQLLDIEKDTVLITSSVDSNGLFNLIKEPYATVVSQDKLYNDLIRMMADDIATHVLAYFKGETE